jgi:hypothetical protein
MKAPIAQAVEEAASPPGCAFIFFLGPTNRKIHLNDLGFRLGSDLVILSKARELGLLKKALFGASKKLRKSPPNGQKPPNGQQKNPEKRVFDNKKKRLFGITRGLGYNIIGNRVKSLFTSVF